MLQSDNSKHCSHHSKLILPQSLVLWTDTFLCQSPHSQCQCNWAHSSNTGLRRLPQYDSRHPSNSQFLLHRTDRFLFQRLGLRLTYLGTLHHCWLSVLHNPLPSIPHRLPASCKRAVCACNHLKTHHSGHAPVVKSDQRLPYGLETISYWQIALRSTLNEVRQCLVRQRIEQRLACKGRPT